MQLLHLKALPLFFLRRQPAQFGSCPCELGLACWVRLRLASSPSALRQLCLATFRRTNLVLTLGLSPENVQTFSKRWRMIRKPSPVGRMTAKLFTYLNEREPKRDQPRTLTVSLAQLCQSLSGPDGHLQISGITAFHSCGAGVLPQTVLLLVIADLPEAARAGASNPPLTAAPASHSPVSAGA